MKSKLLLHLCALSLAAFVPAGATTLNVAASDTLNAGLYNYTYTFSVAGGTVDNVYLGSADLSPLNLAISFDGTATTGWSWLGNISPQNYLQFFRTSGSVLTAADSLAVTFTSALSPSQNNFAIALNSATGDTTAALSNVLAPGAGSPATAPEPASFGLTLIPVAALGIAGFLRKRGKAAA